MLYIININSFFVRLNYLQLPAKLEQIIVKKNSVSIVKFLEWALLERLDLQSLFFAKIIKELWTS